MSSSRAGSPGGRDKVSRGPVEIASVRQRLDAARRTAEAAGARSRALITAAEAGSAIWSLDLRSGAVTGSEQIYELFGLEREHPLTLASVLERVHHEDRPLIEERLRSAPEGVPAGLELRVVRSGDDVRWLRLDVEAIREDDQVVALTGSARDVTQAHRRRERVSARESRAALLAQVVATMSEAVVIVSPDGLIVDWNAGAEQIYGYNREEVVGRPYAVLVPAAEAEAVDAVLRAAFKAGTTPLHGRRVRRDGSLIDVAGSVSIIRDADRATAAVTVARDVTAERRFRARLEESERLLTEAHELAGLGSWRWDPAADRVTWSEQLFRIFGIGHADFDGTFEGYLARVHPEDRDMVEAAVGSVTAGSEAYEFEHRIVRSDGAVAWLRSRGQAERDEEGTLVGLYGTAMDVTAEKRDAARMERLAFSDALTGLANRAALDERLARTRSPDDGLVAVLMVDLDDFKVSNDIAGHATGDEILAEVGRRIQACVRPEDMVARLGGDEFVVVLENVADSTAATAAAERVRAELARPFEAGGRTFVLGASIGVALGDGARDGADLLRDADVAMYEAKAAGKGKVALFEPAMHERVVAQDRLEREIRRAVAEDQLRLLYQPKVALDSGRAHAVEALVRWQHPERGLLGPAEFVPLAEAKGLIVEIDAWVLSEAVRQARAWRDAGLRSLTVCVNVSTPSLEAGGLAERVGALLGRADTAAHLLEVEITETAAVAERRAAFEEISSVRELGVRVVIDDFGMGHSSLSRLQSFPVDGIKIDRAFVAPLDGAHERGSLAEAMIAMGNSLGLDVVAEGVETPTQLRALRRLGCRYAQGYLFSAPATPEALEALARDGILTFALPAAQPQAAPQGNARERERRVRTLLAELQRLTGLESTYLTRVDLERGLQEVTHAHNTAALAIEEGITIDWGDTLCKRALEQDVPYTDDARTTFANSPVPEALGIQTYVGVAIPGDGALGGTLCGASSDGVPLGPAAIKVMEAFAALIAEETAAEQRAREDSNL